MAQVWISSGKGAKWVLALAGVMALGGAWIWRVHVLGAPTAVRTVDAARQMDGALRAPQAEAATSPAQDDAAIGAARADDPKVMVIKAQQDQAAEALARQPVVSRSAAVVTQRPEYVSELEWLMLKGVAQQRANPEQELARMVNFLRFNKQMELWQSLAGNPDATRRSSLATELLLDLPERVSHGDLALKDASEMVPGLVNDVVADPHARAARVGQETARLQAAQRQAPTAARQ